MGALVVNAILAGALRCDTGGVEQRRQAALDEIDKLKEERAAQEEVEKEQLACTCLSFLSMPPAATWSFLCYAGCGFCCMRGWR